MQYLSSGYPVDGSTECFLFEELLFQKLLIYQAKLDSVEVSEQQIEAEINRRLQFFIDQIGSQAALENYYGKTISEIKNEYASEVKDQLISQTMQSNLTSNLKITPKQIKDYYADHQDSIENVNSQVKIAHLVLKPTIKENEKLELKKKLEGIRTRIIEGEDFGTLAVLYSEDQGSAVKKGELGFMSRDMLVPEFSAAAFKLSDGEVSEVVESEFGYHIIELVEKRGQQANFRHILIKPQVSYEHLSASKLKLDSLRKSILDKEITFDQAVEKHSTDEQTKFNQGVIKDLNSGEAYFDVEQLGQLDANLFFSIEKLEEGQLSDPVLFQHQDGTQSYRIVKLLERKMPHKMNLKDDYNKIREKALLEKKQSHLQKWTKEKVKSTYINIHPKHKNCSFENQWN